MDISKAIEEPLPSRGQHQNSLEETTTHHRRQASPHPISEQLRLHQQKQSKSLTPTTRNEMDPRMRRPRRAQDHQRSSMHWNFSEVTPPRRTRRVTPPSLVRKPEQGFHLEIVGDMKECHDNASKKGNDAHGRRRRRTGQRHGKAFASIFTSPHKHPHIDGHRIVHDVSQAPIPQP
uniref:Uncharacterized protein n=1 Tax=Oryza nivara TaxID=4536 RepID=A0A0E0FFQ4_ORYNI